MSDEEKTLVKVDQALVDHQLKSEKATSGLFHFLGIHRDNYSHLSFTPEEARSIRSHLSHLVTGATAAIPLVCGGEKLCPFKESCPFIRADRARVKAGVGGKKLTPVGLQCLVEVELLSKWTFFYIDEYEIDETSFTEVQMVRELAEIELMLWRLNNNLAKPENAELVQEVNVGIDKEGNALTRQEVNAFITAKETLNNRKSKIVKLMVGDRQEKYKREAALKLKNDGDPSTTAATLRNQMDLLVRQTQKLNLDLKQIEGKVIDVEVEDKPLTPEDLIDDDIIDDDEE